MKKALKGEPAAAVKKETDLHRSRWNILLIGSEGRIVPFKHFKAFVLILAGVGILGLAALGLLFFLYSGTAARYRSASAENAALKARLEAQRSQNDLLTTRLMLLESRFAAETTAATHAQAADPTASSAASSGRGADADRAAKADDGENAAIAADVLVEDPPSAGDAAAREQEKVSIDNWFICHDPVRNRLKVSFKVMNVGSKKQPVSGRVVAVLKAREENPDSWLVLPRVRLENKRPTGRKGQAFRIYNYRTVKFSVDGIAYPENLAYATVYVFSSGDSRLLLERRVPFNIERRCP